MVLGLHIRRQRGHRAGQVDVPFALVDGAQRVEDLFLIVGGRQGALGAARQRVDHDLVLVLLGLGQFPDRRAHFVEVLGINGTAVVQRDDVADGVVSDADHAGVELAVAEGGLDPLRLHDDGAVRLAVGVGGVKVDVQLGRVDVDLFKLEAARRAGGRGGGILGRDAERAPDGERQHQQRRRPVCMALH